MTSQTRFVRIAWVSMVPQLLIMGLMIFIYYKAGSSDFLLNGCITYLIVSFGLRTIIPREHLKGIRLVKQSKYSEALVSFQKSYEFFDSHRWLDRYRYVTLLSASKMSYREMACGNKAYCYEHMGERDKAIQTYQSMLIKFPDSELAKLGLSMLASASRV